MEKSNELNRQQHYTPDSKPMVKGVASACFALDVDVCVCAPHKIFSRPTVFFPRRAFHFIFLFLFVSLFLKSFIVTLRFLQIGNICVWETIFGLRF